MSEKDKTTEDSHVELSDEELEEIDGGAVRDATNRQSVRRLARTIDYRQHKGSTASNTFKRWIDINDF